MQRVKRTALGSVLLGPDAKSTADVLTVCRTFHEAGIQHLIFNMANVHELWPNQVFGNEIIPEVAMW